jgi:hypothetical protein
MKPRLCPHCRRALPPEAATATVDSFPCPSCGVRLKRAENRHATPIASPPAAPRVATPIMPIARIAEEIRFENGSPGGPGPRRSEFSALLGLFRDNNTTSSAETIDLGPETTVAPPPVADPPDPGPETTAAPPPVAPAPEPGPETTAAAPPVAPAPPVGKRQTSRLRIPAAPAGDERRASPAPALPPSSAAPPTPLTSSIVERTSPPPMPSLSPLPSRRSVTRPTVQERPPVPTGPGGSSASRPAVQERPPVAAGLAGSSATRPAVQGHPPAAAGLGGSFVRAPAPEDGRTPDDRHPPLDISPAPAIEVADPVLPAWADDPVASPTGGSRRWARIIPGAAALLVAPSLIVLGLNATRPGKHLALPEPTPAASSPSPPVPPAVALPVRTDLASPPDPPAGPAPSPSADPVETAESNPPTPVAVEPANQVESAPAVAPPEPANEPSEARPSSDRRAPGRRSGSVAGRASGAAREAYERGNASLLSGDTAGALQAYKEAISRDPEDPSGYRGLGLAYAERGDRAAAIRFLRAYLSIAPHAADRRLIKRRIRHLIRR